MIQNRYLLWRRCKCRLWRNLLQLRFLMQSNSYYLRHVLVLATSLFFFFFCNRQTLIDPRILTRPKEICAAASSTTPSLATSLRPSRQATSTSGPFRPGMDLSSPRSFHRRLVLVEQSANWVDRLDIYLPLYATTLKLEIFCFSNSLQLMLFIGRTRLRELTRAWVTGPWSPGCPPRGLCSPSTRPSPLSDWSPSKWPSPVSKVSDVKIFNMQHVNNRPYHNDIPILKIQILFHIRCVANFTDCFCPIRKSVVSSSSVFCSSLFLYSYYFVPLRNMVSFEFSEANLTFGSEPQVVCAVCTDTGHTTSSCPEEQLPPLTPLPKLRPDYIQMLNSLCVGVTR